MKKFLSILFAVIMSASVFGALTACSPSNGDLNRYDEDGNLIMTVWAPDQYAGASVKAKFQSYLDKFNETAEMKELKVKLQFTPLTQLPTSLKTACLSGPSKMPGIVIWDRFATPSNTNYLMSIDELIERDGVDKTKFFAEAYNELTVDGKQYGLPLDADPWGIYVNMDLIAEYNESAAEGDKIDITKLNTWTALMNAGEKLTVKKDGAITRSGLNTTSADGQFFSFVFTGSGELINTDKSSDTYGDTVMKQGAQGLMNDGQSLRVYDSLAFFNELYKKDLCNTGHGGTDAFGNGLCAMTYGSIYFPQELSSYNLKNYKMLPYPARDRTYLNGEDKPATLVASEEDKFGMINGQVGGMLGGYGLAIPQPTNPAMRNAEWNERVEKAWSVIKLWLLNDTMQELYYTENEVITCRSDLWSKPYYTENTGVIADILPYIQNYKMRPSVAGYETFESSVVRSEIQSLREGSQTVLKTYDDIRDSGNTLLRQSQGR